MRPLAAKELHDTLDPAFAHDSEILIQGAFWLGFSGTNVKSATLVTYFDERERYTWEVLLEFDTTDPNIYDIDLGGASSHEPRKCTVYYKADELQRAKERLHRKFRERESAITYAVFEKLEKYKSLRPVFETKDPIPENFKFSTNWSGY
jgi:hypothetical protein